MNKLKHVCITAALAAGLLGTAGPATAAPAPKPCKPELLLLKSLPSTDGYVSGEVLGLGAGDLSVGSSEGVPVFWEGVKVTAVPLPAGWTAGKVNAVNAGGLMVGTLTRDNGREAVAFTYRKGDAAVALLSAAGDNSWGADVNDAGYVVGTAAGTATVWRDGQVVRRLPVPADAHSSTKVGAAGINKRGDIVGTATTYYWDEAGDYPVGNSFPVVWPAGGYDPYSLLVENQTDYTIGNRATDLDAAGRVVGFEDVNMKAWYRTTAQVWKKPYDALPTLPGKLPGHVDGELYAISPTTNVSVGSAMTYEENYPQKLKPQYWPGSGPMLTLPLPNADATGLAKAVSDDDRVGGTVIDYDHLVGESAAVWTCASKQAYAL
ncbi:hypothetical protein ACIQUQ_25090 [Streptomyces sp. NPDC101118]|uniref:hypothetical protein n=1 Tax=Streptomyces sp. NPDC101118 TaxID=3366109 RepID=UPI00381218B4